MYLIDFLKSALRKSNITAFIYLGYYLLPFIAVVTCGAVLLHQPVWLGVLLGLLVSLVVLAFLMSPIGERMLRKRNGCQPITDPAQREYLMPLFNEVYGYAKQCDPSLADDIQLFINNAPEPNAFALGRKTICVTEGLLYLPPEQLEATLAHEFGHLSHKDTDMLLVTLMGGLMYSVVMAVRAVVNKLLFGFLGMFGFAYGGVDGIAFSLFSRKMERCSSRAENTMYRWRDKIGMLLLSKASRAREFEADAFAFNMGYGNELCHTLYNLDPPDGRDVSFFAMLERTHPKTSDRIAYLQQLDAAYQAQYAS